MKCRFCNNELKYVFADLGTSPPSNSFLTAEQLHCGETYYPLKVFVCDKCFLVQIDEFKKSTEIFSEEYVYFSSISDTWLNHSQKYVETMTDRLGLTADSFVVEIASNDGYLLQYVQDKGIPCLGIEPTASTASVAKSKGIPTIEEFFGTVSASRLVDAKQQADLLLGNNVLAHVPDINDFVEGLRIALKPGGTITMEFPHLMRLVEGVQFDTIYHEHFSYLSIATVREIFRAHGLEIYDVEELPTHGGSIRIFAKHTGNADIQATGRVSRLLDEEKRRGMDTLEFYANFMDSVKKIKMDFLHFLWECESSGKTVGAYGAAAKGNTLLNYCGIKSDMIAFVCDRAGSKQGKFLPGSRIPVLSEAVIKERKPDYIIIFPWNIRDEIENQLAFIREWNGQFVTAIPTLTIS